MAGGRASEAREWAWFTIGMAITIFEVFVTDDFNWQVMLFGGTLMSHPGITALAVFLTGATTTPPAPPPAATPDDRPGPGTR